MKPSDTQREVTRIALAGIGWAGFALAGSGAIREHGVIDRPTEDVDLFTTTQDTAEFARAVERVVADLRANGYTVEEVRRHASFARLEVRTSEDSKLDLDMGVDWRENDPVRLAVGPVLSIQDAVGNKVSAVYSRGEPRDYLDLDAIRRWCRFTDQELVNEAAKRDPGFEVNQFAQALEAVRRVTPLDVKRYGVTAHQLKKLQDRCIQWAEHLRTQMNQNKDESSRQAEQQLPLLARSHKSPETATPGHRSNLERIRRSHPADGRDGNNHSHPEPHPRTHPQEPGRDQPGTGR